MRPKLFLSLLLITLVYQPSCASQDWQSLWKNYKAKFTDNQVRVIDHDAGDRTTSEGQAYGMFFSLVADDRPTFDALLHWTDQNLAQGNLGGQLPAWLWGHSAGNKWNVLDNNSAADADIWMAYTFLEAGRAWNEPRYTKLGVAMARQIAAREVVNVPGFGVMVAPGANGFQHGNIYRFNSSYVPLQLILGLAQFAPDGPWKKVAQAMPALIRDSAPHGFVSDWTDLKSDGQLQVNPTIGSYDAIRVYLWAGMLDKRTPQRGELLKSLSGMDTYLHTNSVPPAKVRSDGSIEDPKGPIGFSAALLPYAAALGDRKIESQQMLQVQSGLDPHTGLYGSPAKYYDQNLALFGLGFEQQQFSFDSNGNLKLKWNQH